jgi:hypothetical protein
VLWVHDENANLGRIDVATGAYTHVGVTKYNNIDVELSDIAFSPSGQLYGVRYEPFVGANSALYMIDTGTAALTKVGGSTGFKLNALVFSRVGTLLAAGQHDVVSLDQTTAAGTKIMEIGS